MSTPAIEAMRFRREPLRLLIFDCGGVLLDSEPLCDRVVTAGLAALGWTLTPSESSPLFLAHRLSPPPVPLWAAPEAVA